MIVENMMEYYNIYGDPKDDDARDIHILESEGIQEIKGLVIFFDKLLKPLKIKK